MLGVLRGMGGGLGGGATERPTTTIERRRR